MKNNSVKVFALGAVSACLVMGAAYSAVGASRNIAVEEGIRMQINNTAFVPKDAKGNPVSPFLYNGTTYVPMRPLCEAIGLTVSYDSAAKMVSVTAPTTPPAQETIMLEAGIPEAVIPMAPQFPRTRQSWQR